MIIAAHYPQVALGPLAFPYFESRPDRARWELIRSPPCNVDVSGLIGIPTSSELVIFLWAGFEPMGEWRDPSLAARWTSLFSPTPTRELFPITKGLDPRSILSFFFTLLRLRMWCMPTRERTSSLLFLKNARPKHSWRCATPKHNQPQTKQWTKEIQKQPGMPRSIVFAPKSLPRA